MTEARGAAAAEQLRQEGGAACKGGRFSEGIRWYSAALEADAEAAPLDVAKLRTNLSVCRLELGDWVGAAADARLAVVAAPSFAKAHYRLGCALEKRNPAEAIEAFDAALALDPHNKTIERHRAAARVAHAAMTASEGAMRTDMSAQQLTVRGWAASPPGVLDTLIATHGEEAVLGGADGSSYLKALFDAHQRWHDGLKASLICTTTGALFAKAAADSSYDGPQAVLPKFDPLPPLRLLTSAIWGFDQPNVACPMLHAFIDGRLYQHEQLKHALQGLLTTCEERHSIHGAMEAAEIRENVTDTDLTDQAQCDRLESIVRGAALYAHVTVSIIAGACGSISDVERQEILFKLGQGTPRIA